MRNSSNFCMRSSFEICCNALFNGSVCKIPRIFERVGFRIFERKAPLTVSNSRKILNATFFCQIVSQNLRHKNLGFSETGHWCDVTTCPANRSYFQHSRPPPTFHLFSVPVVSPLETTDRKSKENKRPYGPHS